MHNMGFGSPKKPKDIDPLPGILSRKLAKALKKRKLVNSINIGAGTVEFKKLLKEQKPKKVKKALKWHIHHFNDEYAPKALSAKTFRAKFDRIYDAMLRSIKPKISTFVQELSNRLRRQGWIPRHSKHLEDFLQISLDRYTTFWNKLDLYINKLKGKRPTSKEEDLLGLYTYLRYKHTFLIPPKPFVEHIWLGSMTEYLNSFEGYSGSLLKLSFKEESKTWEKLATEYTVAYCGTYKWWDDLLEAANKEKA